VRSAGDIDCLIGNPLDIGANLDGGDHFAKIFGDRLKATHHLNPLPVDLDLKKVDLLVISDGVVTKIVVTFKKALDGVLKVFLRQARHRQNAAPEFIQGRREIGKRVGAGWFGMHDGISQNGR
jgi:hypothetical protein